ncbi:hypothetical protein SUGI_0626410 [Cryptomeria japonica]|uniref:uncharacterized protein LOC131065800 n=1 Tax=Cryptomeria japonica TaxID=3369 RepID=UPI002414A121|nr:uncharacterized protein LOC131065800 [Cryptomeria japonica]GLJ31240.1 hypothetical protein SUGI_0626410 [Cryptomeria japonica]
MRESEHKSNDMVVGLMEEQCISVQSLGEFQLSSATESMEVESNAQSQLHIDILKSIMSEMSEEEISISAQIVRYKEFAGNEGQQHSSSVVSHLRSLGFDAAICRSEPKHDRSFPAGKYEFMDVLVRNRKEKSTRILVDMDFRTQFEIARPSSEYSSLIQLLPLLYVGNAEKLAKIVKTMSKSAKMSLKTKGMCIPPWRTYAYMHSKWLSSCRRITSHFPEEIMSFHGGGAEECIELKWSEDFCQKSENQRMGKPTSKLPTVLMEAGLSSMFKVVAVA